MSEPTVAKITIVEYSYTGKGFRGLEYGTKIIVNGNDVPLDDKSVDQVIEQMKDSFDVVQIEKRHEVW